MTKILRPTPGAIPTRPNLPAKQDQPFPADPVRPIEIKKYDYYGTGVGYTDILPVPVNVKLITLLFYFIAGPQLATPCDFFLETPGRDGQWMTFCDLWRFQGAQQLWQIGECGTFVRQVEVVTPVRIKWNLGTNSLQFGIHMTW